MGALKWRVARWVWNSSLLSEQRESHDIAMLASRELMGTRAHLNHVCDQLAANTLELESLKNKILERAESPPILKARTAAEIRRVIEQQNEREFEEQANGH